MTMGDRRATRVVVRGTCSEMTYTGVVVLT